MKSNWLATMVVASLLLASPYSAADDTSEIKKCRWWQIGCSEQKTDGLPDGVPREGVAIAIDVSTQRGYLVRDGEIVREGPVSTGTDRVLKKGRRFWLFRTPRGRHKVIRKIVDPVWRKPDWAFVEEGERVPPPDSPKRLVKGKLGKYALDLGDGILIHGTKDVDQLGQKASHGCIRMPADMLELVYNEAKVGTEVHVFESVLQTASDKRSDLDYLK